MSLRRALLIFGFPLMLAVTMPLCAQSGCIDSPEDPTIVLAAVGAAALAAARMRMKRPGREGRGTRGK